MRIETSAGAIELVNEPGYTFGSADNARSYRLAWNFGESRSPSSVHGLLIEGEPIAIFGRGGGATGVHEHSLVCVDGLAYLAVGDCVVCVEPRPFSFKWKLQVDDATCFGVYYNDRHRALISHGELAISRFSEKGALVWCAQGADIFTAGFALLPQYIEAVDWNGRNYRFSYADGTPI